MIETGDFVSVMPFYHVDILYIELTSARGKFGFSWDIEIV